MMDKVDGGVRNNKITGSRILGEEAENVMDDME